MSPKPSIPNQTEVPYVERMPETRVDEFDINYPGSSLFDIICLKIST